LDSAQFNGKRESVYRLEVEKALYSAAEVISSTIVTAALPNDAVGCLDLWELENKITRSLTEAVNSINEVAPALGEDLSFEIKRRRSFLVNDLVNLFVECLKDAYGQSVEVDRRSARRILIKLSNARNKDFIKKEFKSTVYDVLRYLLGK